LKRPSSAAVFFFFFFSDWMLAAQLGENGPAECRPRVGAPSQAATWAGGANSAQCRNPHGLFLAHMNPGR
jgi:hypothetical protein